MESKVAIVGGGIAGLKAAVELEKAGVSYVLLEAKARLGGRLHTVKGLNTKYDLGASWFHETLNNNLFDEEKSLGDKGTKTYFDDGELGVFNSAGEISRDLKLSPIVNEIKKFIEIESYKELGNDEPLNETLIKYFSLRKNLLSKDQINYSFEMIRSLELWHGIHINILSSKYSTMDNAGRDALAQHYDTMLNRHIDSIPSEKIKLNTVINSITKVKLNSIEITSVENDKFICEYAIVTVPQSILQLQDENETGFIKFTPPLPKPIKESLSKVHFGSLGKVVLEFDECFWNNNFERVLVLAEPPSGFYDAIVNNEKSIPQHSLESTPTPKEYPILFLNLFKDFGIPSLVSLTQSPLTEYLEKLDNDKVWEFFKQKLQPITNATNPIPKPKNMLKSNWSCDPFQRGSYSACYPNDDPIEIVIAMEQGFGNIRFAGEHTILEGTGCVHGAWNSGKREVEYILNNMENIKTPKDSSI